MAEKEGKIKRTKKGDMESKDILKSSIKNSKFK